MSFRSKYNEAKKEAKKISSKLELRDFSNIVKILHGDDSSFELHFAMYKKFGHFLIVITEHQGNFIFCEEDLEFVAVKKMYSKTSKFKYLIDNRNKLKYAE